MTHAEKRTRNHPGQPVAVESRPAPRPPGARHGPPPPSLPRGGYQDECSGSEFAVRAADVRLVELRRSGVGKAWMAVAEAIGYEAFLVVWQVLDGLPEVADDRHRVYVPRWPSFLRFQRNLLVRTLAQTGASPEQIQAEVLREVGEMMSRTHVRRLVKSVENGSS